MDAMVEQEKVQWLWKDESAIIDNGTDYFKILLIFVCFFLMFSTIFESWTTRGFTATVTVTTTMYYILINKNKQKEL